MRLSVIIPFYNVEKYISECLDSVYSQDIPESEYEVICINDCSPDNSRQIVLDYQRQHPNLILLEHETNKMLGAGRNTGLRAAKGDYVWFIDSDDYIDKNVFGKLLCIAESNELEILAFNAQKVDDKGLFSEYYAYFPIDTDIITGVAFLKIDFPFWKKPVTAWSKIYKLKFLKDNNFNYPEGIFFEDEVINLKTLFESSRFQFRSEIIYFYRSNENSIMNVDVFGAKKLSHRIIQFNSAIILLDEIKYREPVLTNFLIKYFCNLLVHHKKSILFFSINEKKVFYNGIKDIDCRVLLKYISKWKCFFLIYPKLTSNLSIILFPFLNQLRKLKRKIFNKA